MKKLLLHIYNGIGSWALTVTRKVVVWLSAWGLYLIGLSFKLFFFVLLKMLGYFTLATLWLSFTIFHKVNTLYNKILAWLKLKKKPQDEAQYWYNLADRLSDSIESFLVRRGGLQEIRHELRDRRVRQIRDRNGRFQASVSTSRNRHYVKND